MGGFDLAAADRLHPAAEHLGQIGAAIQAKSGDCSGYGVEADANSAEAEVDDEELGENRYCPEHFDIDVGKEP